MMRTKAIRIVGKAMVPALLASAAACAPDIGDAPNVKVRSVAVKSDANPMDESYYYQSAVDAIMKRDYASALDYLQSARAMDPHSARILNAFGVVYDKLGRFDLSQRYYAEAHDADPQSTIVAQNLAYSKVLQGMADGSSPGTVTASSPAAPDTKLASANPAPAVGTRQNGVVATLDGLPFQFSELTPDAFSWPSAPTVPSDAVAHKTVTAANLPSAPSKAASAVPAPVTNYVVQPKRSASDVFASMDGTPLEFTELSPKALAWPQAPTASPDEVVEKTATDAYVPAHAPSTTPAMPRATTAQVIPEHAPSAPSVPHATVAEATAPARAPNIAQPVSASRAETSTPVVIPTALQAEVLVGVDVAPEQSAAKSPPQAAPAPSEAPSRAPQKPSQTSMLAPQAQRSEIKVASSAPSSSWLDSTMTLQATAQSKPVSAPALPTPVAAKPAAPTVAAEPQHQAQAPHTLAAHVLAPPAKPMKAVAPNKVLASLAPTAKAQPRKGVLLTGHPLSILNASTKNGADLSIRRDLTQHGWSLAAPHIGSVEVQAFTTLVYPQDDLAVARGLVRTLSIPVHLVANSCDCGGLQLIIGNNLPNRKFASLDSNAIWPVELKFASLDANTLGEP